MPRTEPTHLRRFVWLSDRKAEWRGPAACVRCSEDCSRFPNEFFWIDIFCKNQRVVNSADTALELQRCVKAACKLSTHKPHVLFLVHPWPEPVALGRIWCLFELMHALLCNAVIRMETSREARDSIVGQNREEQLELSIRVGSLSG